MRFYFDSRGTDARYGNKCAIAMGALPIAILCLVFWNIGLL